MQPIEQNQINQPSQARILATISCTVLGIILLICLAVYLLVARWYSPKLANDFIDSTYNHFTETKDPRNALEDDISSHFEKYYNILNISQVPDADFDNSIKIADNAINKSNELLNDYPKSNTITKDLNSELYNYISKTQQLASDYKKDVTLMKEIKKISDTTEIINNEIEKQTIKSVDSVEEYNMLSSLYSTKASEVEKLKNDFTNIADTENTKNAKEIVMQYLESTIKYYRARSDNWALLAQAYQNQSNAMISEVANDAENAKKSYEISIEKFIDDSNTFNKNSEKVQSSITSEFRKLRNEYDKVYLMFDEFRAKYN